MPMNETELELNPEVLKEQSGEYSSLTDLYGVRVFTDDFTSQVQALVKQQMEQTEGYRERVFLSDYDRKTAKTGYETLLFRSVEQTERIQTYEYAGKGNMIETVSGLMIALLLVAGIYYLMNRMSGKGRQRKEWEDSHA